MPLPSLRATLALALAAFPWLNPLAGGPSPNVQPWLASAACGLALWLLAALGPAAVRLRVPWPVLAVVAWAALSQLALRPEFVYLAAGLLLIALVASATADAQVTGALQTGLLVAAAVSAVLGLCQYLGLAASLAPWASHAQAGDAYGNLRQPNQFASLMWIGAAVVLWSPLRLPRPLAFALVALLAIGSAASASRTALLQGVLLAALAALWNGPRRRERLALCATAAVAYLAAVLLLPMLLETLGQGQAGRTVLTRLAGGESCSSRKVLWSNVLYLILQKPLTGWGWGDLDYAHFMTLYPGERFCDILDNAHDLPLHLAVELGLPLALLACAGALVWAWRRRPWREPQPQRQLAWAMLAVILLHSLLEYPLWYGPFQIAFGAALGWLGATAATAQPGRQTARASGPVAPHVPSLAAAAALLALLAYAAWDYERVSQIYLAPEQRRPTWQQDTLEHVRRSWLFAGQAGFAELTLASVTRQNAARLEGLAHEMLHYSPEPRVIERVIESETLLGRSDEAVVDLARYRAAFPGDYQAWRSAQVQR